MENFPLTYGGWTKSISHHLRDPGMIIPLQMQANNDFPWDQSCAAGLYIEAAGSVRSSGFGVGDADSLSTSAQVLPVLGVSIRTPPCSCWCG